MFTEIKQKPVKLCIQQRSCEFESKTFKKAFNSSENKHSTLQVAQTLVQFQLKFGDIVNLQEVEKESKRLNRGWCVTVPCLFEVIYWQNCKKIARQLNHKLKKWDAAVRLWSNKHQTLNIFFFKNLIKDINWWLRGPKLFLKV